MAKVASNARRPLPFWRHTCGCVRIRCALKRREGSVGSSPPPRHCHVVRWPPCVLRAHSAASARASEPQRLLLPAACRKEKPPAPLSYSYPRAASAAHSESRRASRSASDVRAACPARASRVRRARHASNCARCAASRKASWRSAPRNDALEMRSWRLREREGRHLVRLCVHDRDQPRGSHSKVR